MAEEEKKELTLEQAKKIRLFLRIAFFLVAFLTPMLIIGFEFNLFTKPTATKWSITGIILLLVVAWRFKKKLGEWITSWESENIFKHILIGIGKVWPFLLVVCVVAAIQFSTTKLIASVLSCLEWTCACELAAYVLIYPFEMKMDYKVKRIIRKNERKEDYKEAIKEMETEEE